jgi:general secretion pathway protein L
MVTSDGRKLKRYGSAAAALLPEPGGTTAEIVAVMPIAALSWHQVLLPRGTSSNSPRIRAVLEGLLEERLLDEPDSLHFALQPQARAGEPVWVAACDRAWLRAAVQVLESADRPATRIVPEFAPEGEPRVYALGETDNAQLVVASAEGVMAAPLAAGSLALLPTIGEDAPLTAAPPVAELAHELLQHKVTIQQLPKRLLEAAQTSWDLAQFDFTSSGRARTFKKIAGGWADVLRAPQWRPGRWAAVLLVALNLVGLNVWAWSERSALDAKRVAIRSALTQTFPNVTPVSPLVQMEKEVALLRISTGASSSRDLEAMLAVLGELAPGQVVTGLEFTNGVLRVKGLTAATEDTGLAARLRARGLRLTVEGNTAVLSPESAP